MIVCMETKDDLRSTLAQLPDGQRVKIETVHSVGFASLRRINGEWAGWRHMQLGPSVSVNTAASHDCHRNHFTDAARIDVSDADQIQ